ncbi:hypothetical protein Isop_1349 [Isosphaera pallida ATCC 43644]|uniref:Uncharacterized protein n=2 Tax=Isosphaera pallida TaxID=128 RepID=E8QX93_ISOPI|nr:hypothetical protein Isop_1349 [Isosphaera pallida ATCC 43644]
MGCKEDGRRRSVADLSRPTFHGMIDRSRFPRSHDSAMLAFDNPPPSPPSASPPRPRRERSARYPGVPLSDSLELCQFLNTRGLDGLSSQDIATALGYKNIKTNTFSSRLSSARQFGLLDLKGDGYHLTPLAHALLHPVDPEETPRLLRQAFREPPLYADLLERFAQKRLPDPTILGNVLYHDYNIIVSAKQVAADAFIASARFAGLLGPDQILRPDGIEGAASSTIPSAALPAPPEIPHLSRGGPSPASSPLASAPLTRPHTTGLVPSPSASSTIASTAATPRSPIDEAGKAAMLDRLDRSDEFDPSAARFELRLWGNDQGKVVKVRAPESMSRSSFERLIRALELHIRIVEDSESCSTHHSE